MIANVCHAARKLVHAGGAHRLTARQLRHELRLAEHQLEGAGHYIAGLERDRRELSAELERVRGELDDANATLVKAADRIVELEGQQHEVAQLREANTALKAQLSNVHAVRPLPPHGDTPPPGPRPVPLGQAPFALSPASPS
ncbi:hypothetical protein ACWCQN_12895 [Streptomyces sp. NPDC001984]